MITCAQDSKDCCDSGHRTRSSEDDEPRKRKGAREEITFPCRPASPPTRSLILPSPLVIIFRQVSPLSSDYLVMAPLASRLMGRGSLHLSLRVIKAIASAHLTSPIYDRGEGIHDVMQIYSDQGLSTWIHQNKINTYGLELCNRAV